MKLILDDTRDIKTKENIMGKELSLGDVRNRRKIQDLVVALEATEELPLTTVANGINKMTQDGRTIQFGHMEKDISANEIYKELIALGVIKKEEIKIVIVKNRYTLSESSPYSKYFTSNTQTVKLKSGFEKIARISLFTKMFKKIRGGDNE